MRKPAPAKTIKVKEEIVIPQSLTVKHLADILDISPIDTIKRLMKRGIMANVNQAIDYDTAASIAIEIGRKPEPEQDKVIAAVEKEEVRITKKEAKALKPRPPVITILGHVDHGKTSLLDAIRHSHVTDTEAGEITQHIGAYQVTVAGQEITFIDTPGHEAFTTMRARGASITDIAILVVAADDGIMPQTIEAIAHVKSAEVPIIVAINKIDKPNADLERVKQQLTEHNLLIEDWGGDVIAIPVSAKTGEGLQDLLEHLLIVAEVAELKANPSRLASGVVIETKLDNTRGTLATLLIQSGTLKIGDIIVVANTRSGKIKAMMTHEGKRIKSAGPSVPVEIMGLSEVPSAGDSFVVVENEHEAKAKISAFQAKQQTAKVKALTLDDVSAQIRAGDAKGINLIIKADVQGSIEPIENSISQLENEEVRVRIIHAASGSITESDVMLAVASKAVIIGFNTRIEPMAQRYADSEGVEIRTYQIIYKLIEDIEKTVTGMLEPTYVDVVHGHAEVRAVFKIKRAQIAGCYITDGKATRSSMARVLRNGQLLLDSQINSLKHFRNDVTEMVAGSECGIGIEGFSDFANDDIIEFYNKEKQ